MVITYFCKNKDFLAENTTKITNSTNFNIMQLFYDPNIVSSQTSYTLNEEESKHCIRVLRLTVDDIIYITDGKGTMCKCRITQPTPKKCIVAIEQVTENYNQRHYKLYMAVAPTKTNERYEWFIEKATEIGIDAIIPIICFQSERRNVNIERYERIANSAMKQSIKAYLPHVEQPTKFSELIARPFQGDKFIAHCNEDQDIKLLKTLASPDRDTLILIGPEGDFSPSEVEQARQHGFKTISLGNTRMRTETAAVAATHTIFLVNQ